MELYLVRGTVEISYYMSDEKRREECTRLVKAVSAESAEIKFRDHWENKSVEYSVHYWVNDVEAFETIK